LYLNAQSIVKKVDELECIAREENPDFILVTESWCNANISDAFLSFNGYTLHTDLRLDRTDTAQGRGGGLLVYSKTGTIVTKLENQFNFTQYCGFKVNDISVYLVYRSPNANAETMSGLVELIKTVERNSIIIGDFNLPEVDWSTGETSTRARDLVEAVENSLMIQMVDFPTHIKGNCLDLILTNMPERIAEVCDVGRLGSSDHIMLGLKVQTGHYQPTIKRVKNWRKADWKSIKEELSTLNWCEELGGLTVDRMWAVLKRKVEKAVKKHVPERLEASRGRPSWMSGEIMAAIRKKKRLWRQVRASGITDEYREEDRRVKRLIRNAKRKFEKKLADNGNGGNRQFFAYIRRKTKSKPTIGPLKDKDKRVVTDDEEMATMLNEFFSSVFTQEDSTNIPAADEMPTASNLGDVKITSSAIRKKIRNLRPNAAAGPDCIGPRLLQKLEDELVEGLTLIFRKSLNSGSVPEDWKCANVTPIFKKGSKADPGNYRPVSLTSVCCKMMESIIKDEMMSHLQKNGLIRASQHGFVPGRSCTTNLLEFLEGVSVKIDEGKPVDVVFLDFAKAFDKVPRERLLEKLRAHGVQGKVLQWIREWLTGRKQRVVLNGKCSTWKDVLSGVPQGSVLGPILFLIFINDLDLAVEMINQVKKFADDMKLGHTVSPELQRRELQQALNNLKEWADKWGMQFNVAKCKVMHCGHSNQQFEYSMDGVKLDNVEEEERDIGVVMNNGLKPAAQCRKAAQTAQNVLSQLTRSFHYRDRNIFLRLYIQYVRPHLEFSSAAWSPWHETDKECLEKVQRRAVNMISGLKAKTYEERLEELGITTLEERRAQLDLIQTYKILTGKDKVEKETWFDMAAQGTRLTRLAADPMNVRQRAARLEVRRNFYSNRVVDQWNRLPAELKNAVTVNSFKNGLKKQWRDILASSRRTM